MFKKIKNNFYNCVGHKITNKIVVFESDDWGAIRTTNATNYDKFKTLFTEYHKNSYLRFDTLANSEDLELLIQSLLKFKDGDGKNPTITLNTVVGNPDFEKIRDTHFQEFHFEPFTETLKSYYPNENVFGLWEQGIEQGVFYPQFHGREHVNVPEWLNLLRNGNEDLLKAFEIKTWSTPKGFYSPNNLKLQAALDYVGARPKEYQTSFLKDGTQLFEKIFGYKSRTWIPNNFIASKELINDSKQYNIEGMQGMIYHVEPKGNSTQQKHTYKMRKFGFDQVGMFNSVRNCSFEPSQTGLGELEVKNCLSQIASAFFWKKPAVISTHRLNFIGAIDPENRRKNLLLFEKLLHEIIKRWPEVKFMHSEQLLNAYKSHQ